MYPIAPKVSPDWFCAICGKQEKPFTIQTFEDGFTQLACKKCWKEEQ